MNRELYKKLESFVNSGTKGKNDHSSICQPFFMQSQHKVNENGYNLEIVNNLLDKISLSNELKIIYQIIGEVNVEYYFDNWILMSLNDVYKHYTEFKKQNQDRVISFALAYLGMGHVIMISYDPVTKKIYYRRDGGSNGWDRELNYKFIIKYVPQTNQGILFNDWLTNIKNKTELFAIKTIN